MVRVGRTPGAAPGTTRVTGERRGARPLFLVTIILFTVELYLYSGARRGARPGSARRGGDRPRTRQRQRESSAGAECWTLFEALWEYFSEMNSYRCVVKSFIEKIAEHFKEKITE